MKKFPHHRDKYVRKKLPFIMMMRGTPRPYLVRIQPIALSNITEKREPKTGNVTCRMNTLHVPCTLQLRGFACRLPFTGLSPKFLRSFLSLSREDRKSLCVQLTNPKGIRQILMKYDVPPSKAVFLKDQQLNLESSISPISCR